MIQNDQLTLDSELDPLADGWRDAVAGDAEVGADVAATDRVDGQRVAVDGVDWFFNKEN